MNTHRHNIYIYIFVQGICILACHYADSQVYAYGCHVLEHVLNIHLILQKGTLWGPAFSNVSKKLLFSIKSLYIYIYIYFTFLIDYFGIYLKHKICVKQ